MEDARQASRRAEAGRGRRYPRVIALLGSFLILAVGMLIGGFMVFAATIARNEVALERPADGIVVLTGGASRIEDAIDLLATKRGQRLLITGVHPLTSSGELTRRSREVERLFGCCIDLDREALNTVGNAVAAARWVKEQKFRSLIVVTSAWHMPRALVELAREMPDVVLVPYPVVSERMREQGWWSRAETARLLFVEYVKYIAALARLRIEPSHIGANRSPGRGIV
jgi:uncharacterized SAM-binding protein YcdF (DUF218 family)